MEKHKETENIEFVSPGQEVNELKKYSLKNWISGRLLIEESFRKQIPFIVFIAFLGFLYIGNRYHAEKLTRKVSQLQQELDELRAESITVASELMFFSRQSQVQKRINEYGLGLKEATEPPRRIKRYN